MTDSGISENLTGNKSGPGISPKAMRSKSLNACKPHPSEPVSVPAVGTQKKSHPTPLMRAFYTQMKRNNGLHIFSEHRLVDHAAAAMEQMNLYCAAHPGSPSDVRHPRLFIRGELWIALLGPSVEEGIVGIGATVTAALRAFDSQYLTGLRSSVGRRASTRESGRSDSVREMPVAVQSLK